MEFPFVLVLNPIYKEEIYMNKLEEKYGFSENGTPVVLSVDGAAAPFIAQLRHQRITTQHKKMWRNIKIMSFTQNHFSAMSCRNLILCGWQKEQVIFSTR